MTIENAYTQMRYELIIFRLPHEGSTTELVQMAILVINFCFWPNEIVSSRKVITRHEKQIVNL